MINNNDNSDTLSTDTESYLIILDSRNATNYLNGSFNSSVIFQFEDSIRFNSKAIKCSCSLSQFISPNSIYTINETNSLLSIIILGVTTNYVIDYGNYNCYTFMTKLIEKLGSNFNIVVNIINNKFTLSNTINNFTINATSTIYNIMGFVNNINYTSSNLSLTFPFTCNFNGVQSLNISFQNLNTNNIDSYTKTNSSIIQSIPIDNTLQQIIFNKTNEFKLRVRQDTIDFIQIDITDNLNNLVNFNNQFWNITLEFTELKDYNRFHYNYNFSSILHQGYNK